MNDSSMKRTAYALVLIFLMSSAMASYTQSLNNKDYGADDDLNAQVPYTIKDPNYREPANFMQKYTTYNPNGSVVDTYIATPNTYTLPNGEVGTINHAWGTTGEVYGNSNPSESIHFMTLDASLGGVQITSQLDYYSHEVGKQDHYGGEYNLSIVGFASDLALPPDLTTYTMTHSFDTPSPSECVTELECSVEDNRLTLPLCPAANCSGESHASILTLNNGFISPSDANWEVESNVTDKALVYKITSPYLDSGDYEVHIFKPGEDNVSVLEQGDALTFRGAVVNLIPKPNNTATSLLHSIDLPLPEVSFFNSTEKSNIIAEPTYGMWYTTEGDLLFSAKGVAENNRNNHTPDKIIFDPTINYHTDSLNTTYLYGVGQPNSNQAWRMGVDRDGGQIYGYGAASRDGTPGGLTPFIPQCEDNFWAFSGLYLSGGSGCESGSWDNNDIGDGWCRSSTIGHAGCQVQGFSRTNNHWKSGSSIGALPLIDSTIDFDGAVMQVEIDKQNWLSQGSVGFDRINIELGLQAMGYGDWVGDKNWFQNCFNGYVDLYAVPEMQWAAWENGARYGFEWRPGQTDYAWNESDPRDVSTINWAIRPDDDIFANEYYYDDVGPSNNNGWTLGTEDSDGHLAGPVDGDPIGSPFTMDLQSSNYWANIPSYYSGGTGYDYFQSGSASSQMKVNMFNYHNMRSGEQKWLNDDNFEDGGGVYTGDRAPGYDNAMAYDQGIYASSFNYQSDYWDINFWSDAQFPYGPAGLYDASLGQFTFNDELGYNQLTGGNTSKLSEYHLQSVQLGDADDDFCYDPTSSSGTLRESNYVSAEPDNVQLISEDPGNGQSYLNIPLSDYNLLAQSARYTTNDLVDVGLVEDSLDQTISFMLLIDIRSRSPLGNPLETLNTRNCGSNFINSAGIEIGHECFETWDGQGSYRDEDHHYQQFGNAADRTDTVVPLEGPYPNRNVCWADWGVHYDQFDGNGGVWANYNQGLEVGMREEFCLDKGGNSVTAGNEVSWDTFIGDNTCKSDQPSYSVNNEAKGFWCGLNLMSPMTGADNIRVVAQTVSYHEPEDSDGDGVLNGDDDCPGTEEYQEVDEFGCDRNVDTDTNTNNEDDADENRPYGGNNDWDVDGVIDLFDKCDTRNGVGYATDLPNYTLADHINYMSGFGNAGRGPVYLNGPYAGCPTGEDTTSDNVGGGDDQILSLCELYPDIGIHGYEDNDGDGRIDEDPPGDGIDNDGDGQEGEDPIDDCPNDNADRDISPMFSGRVESIISMIESDGRKIPIDGDLVIAASKQETAQQSNYESYSVVAGAIYKRSIAGEDIIYADENNVNLQCQPYMRSGTTPSVQATLFIWVPWEQIESIMIQQSLTYSDLNLGQFGAGAKQNYSDPGGTGINGAYVPYGEAASWFNSLNPSPAERFEDRSSSLFYGYSLTGAGQSKTEAQTSFAQNPVMESAFAPGYYRWTCKATQLYFANNGTTAINAVYETSNDFTAVALCDDGLLPTPATSTGSCVRSSGGGGNILTENSILDSIFDSILLAGLVLVLFGIAVLLWLSGRRQLALGFGVLALGIVVGIGSPEDSIAVNLVAHVLILAGVVIVSSGLGTFALVASIISSTFWFALHAYHGFRESNGITTEPIIDKLPLHLNIGGLWWIAAILSIVFIALLGVNAYLFLNEDAPSKSRTIGLLERAEISQIPAMIDLDTVLGGD
jgi:hypothetical protein